MPGETEESSASQPDDTELMWTKFPENLNPKLVRKTGEKLIRISSFIDFIVQREGCITKFLTDP